MLRRPATPVDRSQEFVTVSFCEARLRPGGLVQEHSGAHGGGTAFAPPRSDTESDIGVWVWYDHARARVYNDLASQEAYM